MALMGVVDGSGTGLSSPSPSPSPSSTPAVVTGNNKDDHIILPPPSTTNPLPVLQAALRVDQQEQLLHLLRQDPATHNNSSIGGVGTGMNGSQYVTAATTASNSTLKQLLVFATDRLRTLLLRQGLTDPQQRTWKNKKKNWDSDHVFPYPPELNNYILGTKVLFPTTHPDGVPEVSTSSNSSSSSSSSSPPNPSSSVFEDNDWADAVQWTFEGKLDVITYFLHAHALEQTKAVVHRIQKSFKAVTGGAGSGSSSGGGGGGGGGGGRATANSITRVHHRLVYIPQTTAIVQQLLQTSGLLSRPNVTVTALQLDLFPLESDVYSTEYHNGLRDVTVEMTPSHLITSTARSLLKLQDITGTIPRIQAYGSLAEDVLRKLLHMSVDEFLMNGNPNWTGYTSRTGQGPDSLSQSTGGPVPTPDSGVAALILMDRRVDWVTPMVTPLTYEGLLDDLLGIDAGFLHIPTSLINPPEDEAPQPSEGGPGDAKKMDGTAAAAAAAAAGDAKERIALGVNGGDSLYAEVRNQHVEKFGSFLQNQAMALRASHAEFTAHGKSKDLQEIHQFVKQIPVFAQNLRSLTNHIHLAELVKKSTEDIIFRERWQTERSILEGETCYETLEDLVASQYPPMRFFRLLCLQSLAAGGIKSSRLDALKRDVVQTYGYEYLFLLHNLEQAKVLRRRDGLWMDSASSFSLLRGRLFLIHPEVNTVEPDDAAYVSSGYAPMSVRLVQTAIKGWKDKEEILRELPGRALDIFQTSPPQDLLASLRMTPTQPLGATVANLPANKKKPILCIMYIGGITYMEIAALRFKSQQASFPYHILIFTTEIINGSTLLHSMK